MKNRQNTWEETREKMFLAKDALTRNGCVCIKAGSSFQNRHVIRYSEKCPNGTVRRTIWLGSDPEIIENARNLLAEWQSARDPARCIDPHVRQIWETVRETARVLPRRQRKRFLGHIRSAGTDSRQILRAVLSWPGVQKSKKQHGGHNRKAQLVWPSAREVG